MQEEEVKGPAELTEKTVTNDDDIDNEEGI